jgi:phosphate-selective porin OprO and OprP
MKRVLLAAVLVAAGNAAARAQEPAASPAPESTPVPSPQPVASPPAAEPAEVGRVAAGTDGFSIESDSGDFRLQLRGYIQFDGRFYPGANSPAGPDEFLLRRVRPTFQGTIARYFGFTLTPDFGGGVAVLQDGFIDVRTGRALRVRVGKFKPPVGLERLQPAVATAFVERALTATVLPNRDLGIQVHGDVGSGVLGYAVAVLDGAPDGGALDDDLNSAKDVAGRVFLSPFKQGGSALQNLGVGIAGTTGTQTGPLPSYRSGGQVTIFSYASGVVADGTRSRVVPQLSFYAGPLGLLAEHARVRTAVRRTADGARSRLEARAWQVTAAVGLTGDAPSYNGVRPRHPFDPAQGRWGSLELVARVNGFEMDDRAFTGGFADREASVRKAFGWGAGLNWTLSRNLRQQAGYERTSFTGGAPGGADRPHENALFIRTQLAF